MQKFTSRFRRNVPLGSSRSSPSKKRAIGSGLRSVSSGVPTWFQCATASSMAAPLTALVEWLTARKLPGER